MAMTSEELYSLLIPLGDERLIVPRSCVAEVVRYTPTAAVAEDDGWIRDTVTWRDREVPVLSFEALLDYPIPAVGGRTRVVVFNPLNSADCPAYGVLAQGFPQMVRVNSEVVQPDLSYQAADDSPVICRITMLSETALIPDLEILEPRIAEAVAVS
ncbi:MAG: chemotaxis protein CheW [Gammaproteobacteria bacterium]|nr:chemotaxis protein CheW [Gammaproteobacteria bacterium]